MTAPRAIGLVLLILIIIIGIFLFLPARTLNENLKNGCIEIESIARDNVAVTYLDKWVSESVLDRGYSFVTGMHGRISAKLNGEFIEISPLPEESKSRIKVEYFRLHISTLDNGVDTIVTRSNIAQIDFGLGRNQVILLKNGAILTGYRGHDTQSGHLRKINETTYAYCADARFQM
ncbi:MAG: hypothetical protein KZQ90_20570 [Candidatus Thiodiazotropha sp. (ex Codakia rugifera)]|nr:hypothetical protein [Candidatus Thiodiazotropha sp. (ex Codakia rugifera)]